LNQGEADMASKTSKVSVIGAGHVGSAIAYALVLLHECQEIVLFDRKLPKAEGQAWDINDVVPLLWDINITPSSNYEDLADSDVIVVTVGKNPEEGETRLDVLGKNAEIITSVMKELDKVAPNSVVIIVSNPVDPLTRIAIEASSRPESLIFGSGTVLDTSRLRSQLGKKLNVNVEDVHTYVVGEHGESAFAVWSNALIGAIRLDEFCPYTGEALDKFKQECIEATIKRAYDIAERKGYTNYGIAVAVSQLVGSVLRDENKIFTVSVKALADYRIGDEVVLCLPCIIGKEGVVRKLLLSRNSEEQHLLEQSATRLNEAYNSYNRE